MKNIADIIIKKQIRFDLEIIAQMIEEKSRVLDIGCGDGELLEYLKKTKNVDARGIEISQVQVSKALMRGLSVIQGDAENDLTYYPDNSFDYAILSHTIQATKAPDKILIEMLRVAKCAIVSLPNFAHIKNRLQLVFKGTMPVNKTIPYEWYETPNIHFCSIRDFEKLCIKLRLEIKQEVFLTNKYRFKDVLNNKFFANLFAEYGIFSIVKNNYAILPEAELSQQGKIFLEQKLRQKTAQQYAYTAPNNIS